jgi:ribosomal protein S18 acetylase RimI-like enzyme
MLETKLAASSEDLSETRKLFEEYLFTRPNDPALENFKDEIKRLPGEYEHPKGCIILACCEGQTAGCVALRESGERVGEIKRLYVRPSFRGLKIGKFMMKEIIKQAGVLNYQSVRLDTIPSMKTAQSLYREMGFKEIAAYRFNPNPGTRFFEFTITD